MREMRRYSNQTIRRAARNVRAALEHIRHPDMPTRDRLDALVGQLIKQQFQPIDVARPVAREALILIAAAIPRPTYMRSNVTPNRVIVFDSFAIHDEVTATILKPSHAWQLVIDSVMGMS